MISRKQGITWFCIALSMMILCRSIITTALLPILLIGMLCGSCIYVSKYTGQPKRYRLCFLLSVFFAIATYFCRSQLAVWEMTVLFMVFALLALYRIQNPELLSCAALKHIQRDVFFLLFAHVDEYFVPNVDQDKERKHKNIVKIAVGLSASLAVMLGILFSIAENDFALVVQMMVYSLYSYLPQIVMSCIGGCVLAIILYGFSVGLLQNKWKENFALRDGKQNRTWGCNITEFFYNKTSLSFMLSIILTGNLLLIVIEIYHYWVMISRQAEVGIRGTGYGMILLCLCIESVVCMLAYRYAKSNEQEKIVGKALGVAFSQMVVLFIAMVRYARSLYELGIKKNNSWQLYLFVLILLYEIYFLIAALKLAKGLWGEARGIIAAVVFGMTALLWNTNWFPEYNAKLFMLKYESGVYENENRISRAELDLEEMIAVGENAVPALLSLAEIQVPYGNGEDCVGEVARKGVLSIYRMELSAREWEQLSERSDGEKMEAIVYRLKQNPFYAYGIRNRILESLERYTEMQRIYTQSMDMN